MSTETKEHPIIFSGEMIRAILAGRKTQTRRVIDCSCNSRHITGNLLGEWGLSVPPHRWEGDPEEVNWQWCGKRPEIGDWIEQFQTDVDDHASSLVRCPYGKPGDRLWVRETWVKLRGNHWHERGLFDDVVEVNGIPKRNSVEYRADYDGSPESERCRRELGYIWKPSIHMPRWASRLTLEITDIRVERVRDISEEDAIAEGFAPGDGCPVNGFNTESPYPARAAFSGLWDKLNGPRGFGYESNPWVWVIEFRRKYEQP